MDFNIGDRVVLRNKDGRHFIAKVTLKTISEVSTEYDFRTIYKIEKEGVYKSSDTKSSEFYEARELTEEEECIMQEIDSILDSYQEKKQELSKAILDK